VNVDGAHIAALLRTPQFRQLFPNITPVLTTTPPCCGMAIDLYSGIKRSMLGMSDEQARMVARALGIPPKTPMTIRVASKHRVDSRTFMV
jgi:hypothetical protein